MSNFFSFKRRLLSLFLAAIIAQGATSCFDDQYADKDISSQVQIGDGNLTIPIGYVLPIYLSDIIEIPLAFDSLYIEKESEIDGLSSIFKNLGESVKLPAVLFNVEATNSLPVSLIIENMLPYDADDNLITGMDDIISSEGINIAANDSSTFTINLRDSYGMNSLIELERLKFSLKVSGENGELKSEDKSQYLQIKLNAELPEGITLDLDL